jgi:pyruvate dehydrogenase (quinone)
MSSKTVAEVLTETLVKAGVKRIYGVPGDSLNAITDTIRRTPQLTWVHVRHEETAAFAAGADAQISGTLAVCAGSCGPGNVHLINGLYEAHRSRVPMLAIAAQVPSQELGSNFFQETHPETLFRECSAYCELISHPTQIPRVLEIAMQTAIARNDVAVIVLPGDVAFQHATGEPRVTFLKSPPTTVPAPDDIKRLATMLNAAARVTILGGAGCAGAHDELMSVAGKLNAPIVHAYRGKEHIEYDNPFDVGMTGLLGFTSGYHAMEDADTLLMLGTDFPYQPFYPTDATIIQVDIRGEQLGRRARLDFGVVGDVKDTLAALLPLLHQNGDAHHLERARAHYVNARKELDSLANDHLTNGTIHPQYLTRVLSEVAASDAIFTCDVGSPTLWAARYIQMNGRRRLIGSFNHGSMANAMTQAIGAQAAAPGRQVISMSGDGGLAMLMGDLLTLNQMDLPVKVIVYNNGALAFVELEMKSVGIVDFGTDLKNPNFSKIAEAAGMFGVRVDKPHDLRSALESAFAHDGPALVEVMTNRQELSVPPTITTEQAKGFSLFMVRAVLSGRGDEVLHLVNKSLVSESVSVAKAMLKG